MAKVLSENRLGEVGRQTGTNVQEIDKTGITGITTGMVRRLSPWRGVEV